MNKWFSQKLNKIVDFKCLGPGTGSTFMYLNDGYLYSGKLINVYLFTTFVTNDIIERTDNPNPSKKLKMFLRIKKLRRINETV